MRFSFFTNGESRRTPNKKAILKRFVPVLLLARYAIVKYTAKKIPARILNRTGFCINDFIFNALNVYSSCYLYIMNPTRTPIVVTEKPTQNSTMVRLLLPNSAAKRNENKHIPKPVPAIPTGCSLRTLINIRQ